MNNIVMQILNPVPVGKHVLPPLPYGYDALEPVIDARTLEIHHNHHHKTYVEDLNKGETALEKARNENDFEYIKYLEKTIAFNGSGHILHSLYWKIMTSPDAGGKPKSIAAYMINSYFGNYGKFKAQFTNAASKVEGSGWGILGYNPMFGHLEILQCEKHQNLTQWGIIPVLVCDVWEHAYYLKYQYNRAEYIDKWWSLINWEEVEKLLISAVKCVLTE